MSKLHLCLLLSIAIATLSHHAFADYDGYTVVDGVRYHYYNVSYSTNWAKIAKPAAGEKYIGEIRIPNNITASYTNFEVRGYEEDAFIGQDEMTSLVGNLNYLSNDPKMEDFEGCNSLSNFGLTSSNGWTISYDGCLYKKVNPISGTSRYSLIICPTAKTDFTAYTSNLEVRISPSNFSHPSNIKYFKLNNAEISYNGWGNFVNLKEFDCTGSTKYKCVDGALYSKDGISLETLTGYPRDKFEIPSDVTQISPYAFQGCKINELNLGDRFFSIRENAFEKFEGNITVSSKCNWGSDCFKDFNGNLTLIGDVTNTTLLSSLSTISLSSTIYCNCASVNTIKEYFKGNVVSSTPIGISDCEQGPTWISFDVLSAEKYNVSDICIKFRDKVLQPNENGRYLIDGLVPGMDYTIKLSCTYNSDKSFEEEYYCNTRGVSDSEFKIKTSETKYQSKIRFNITASKDYVNKGLKAGIKLIPDERYNISLEDEPAIALAYSDPDESKDSYSFILDVKDIIPSSFGSFQPYITNGSDTLWLDMTLYNGTTSLKLSPIYNKRTQRTVIIDGITNNGDFKPDEWEIYDSELYYWGEVILLKEGIDYNSMADDRSFSIALLFKKGNQSFTSSVQVSTLPFNLKTSVIDIGPSTAKIGYSYDEGDAENDIDRIELDCSGIKPGDDNLVTGLVPGKTYEANVKVYFKRSPYIDYQRTSTFTFTTSDLILSTEKARNVNPTTTILCANTNIADNESNVGFEWKKNDAPATLDPSVGYGLVYDGRLEGQVLNLQSSHYYDFRAFYEDMTGQKHYTAWRTFDPSDFSYFDPVVHTRNVSNVTHNSVTLHGMRMPGTDEVVSQGFELSLTNYPTEQARILSTEDIHTTETFFTQGLDFSANPDGLLPNTEYTCHSFVQTSKGIYYGEDVIFNTLPEPSGVENVLQDKTDCVIPIAYYNLNGHKINNPINGLFIIVYSDGTSKKVKL